jgi:hypothetical protein
LAKLPFLGCDALNPFDSEENFRAELGFQEIIIITHTSDNTNNANPLCAYVNTFVFSSQTMYIVD